MNRVVAAEDLPAALDAIVNKILAGAPAAIRLQKELMIRWRSTDLTTAVEYGVNAFAVSSSLDHFMTAWLKIRLSVAAPCGPLGCPELSLTAGLPSAVPVA